MVCTIAAPILDVDVCQPDRCPSDCNSQEDCVVVAVTANVAAGTPYLGYNLFGGDLDEWLWRELTGWTLDAVAVLCLGEFVVAVSTQELAIKYSDDLGVTQVEIDQVDVTDWANNPPTQIDGVDQTFIVMCGQNGYMYGSWDAGRTWETTDAGLATVQNLNRVMIARSNQQVIYAVGDDDAIIKSTNGGENWYPIEGPGGLYGLEDITALWVASQNQVLIGTDAGEIYETLDGGTTWTLQNPLPNDALDTTISDIVACGCGSYWLTQIDDVAGQHAIYRNVSRGASGRWFIPKGIVVGGVYAVPPEQPNAIACCNANRAIAVGGEPVAGTTGFIALLA